MGLIIRESVQGSADLGELLQREGQQDVSLTVSLRGQKGQGLLPSDRGCIGGRVRRSGNDLQSSQRLRQHKAASNSAGRQVGRARGCCENSSSEHVAMPKPYGRGSRTDGRWAPTNGRGWT